jgi:hypothetical protein
MFGITLKLIFKNYLYRQVPKNFHHLMLNPFSDASQLKRSQVTG